MSDLLGEALAKYDDANRVAWYFPPWVHELEAAARNWQALTNPDNVQVIDRCAEAIKTEWSNGGTTDDAYALAIVVLNALTARNWHTRSEPDYLAAAKKLAWWLSEAEWEDIDDEIAGEWIVQARSIVDAALTDTAEPETEDE